MTTQSKMVPSGGWMVPSVQCIFFYGLWGFLSKYAQVKGIPPTQESLFQKIGVFVSMPVVAYLAGGGSGPSAGPSPSLMSLPALGLLMSFSSGFSSGIASLFYSNAMANGDASTVSAVTACYPPVTMILGYFFLNENITSNKLIGKGNNQGLAPCKLHTC